MGWFCMTSDYNSDVLLSQNISIQWACVVTVNETIHIVAFQETWKFWDEPRDTTAGMAQSCWKWAELVHNELCNLLLSQMTNQ